MVLRVKFENDKYDYVSSEVIGDLIRQERIAMFYRPSEKRWIDIRVDAVRQERGIFYIGPERRNPPPADLFS
jgi:hypothetical protein